LERNRVLLADDHEAVLQQVESLLGEKYDIVGAVQNGKVLVEAAQKLQPDVIITDISMPVMTGFEAAARIKELGLASKLIFLSVQSGSAYIKKARSLGANGYVLKLYAAEQLPQAVAAVISGSHYISPQLTA